MGNVALQADSMKKTTTKVKSILLQWSEKDNRVIIRPEDKNFQILSVAEAIEACQTHIALKDLRILLDDLLSDLGDWIYQRQDKIAKAFLTTRDAGLLLLLVTKSRVYDEDFETELTQLDLTIAHNAAFSMLPFSVQSLPACHKELYESFCGPSLRMEFNFKKAHAKHR